MTLDEESNKNDFNLDSTTTTTTTSMSFQSNKVSLDPIRDGKQ